MRNVFRALGAKKLFSDEDRFWLNEDVNKQNAHIWIDEQPKEVQALPLHSEKTTVWCGLWASGIVGSYIFKTETGQNVTVNGDRYRDMITDYLVPEIVVSSLSDIWFQKYGANCHTSRESMALARKRFGEQFISRFVPVNWSPISCDITPLDFFLWSYLKSKVYMNKPAAIEALEASITRVTGQIPIEKLERAIEN
uniref:Uncharacterized protein LOC114324347 n=1 Tax=Diabrotica virgifera virgifera TaxID=50390 RepID=A0A6P7EY70_DIAVI